MAAASSGQLSPAEFVAEVRAFLRRSDALCAGWEVVTPTTPDADPADVCLWKKTSKLVNIGANAVGDTNAGSTQPHASRDCDEAVSAPPAGDWAVSAPPAGDWAASAPPAGDWAIEEDAHTLPAAIDVHQHRVSFLHEVLYSRSYGVPVLYVSAHLPSGRPLALAEMWAAVPRTHADRLQQHPWSLLTSAPHPLTGRPTFQLHPCHTHTLMAATETTTLKRGEEFVTSGNTARERLRNYDGDSRTGEKVDGGNNGGTRRDAGEERGGVGGYLVRWLSSVGPVVQLDLPLGFAR